MAETEPEGCNGICLTPGDIGLPEYDGPGVVAYAHPDCPEHGDPLDYGTDPETCVPGEDETARYVRWEDVDHTPAYYPLCTICGKPIHYPARTMQAGQVWEHVGHADHKAVR